MANRTRFKMSALACILILLSGCRNHPNSDDSTLPDLAPLDVVIEVLAGANDRINREKGTDRKIKVITHKNDKKLRIEHYWTPSFAVEEFILPDSMLGRAMQEENGWREGWQRFTRDGSIVAIDRDKIKIRDAGSRSGKQGRLVLYALTFTDGTSVQHVASLYLHEGRWNIATMTMGSAF